MSSLKSIASALALVATAADVSVPVLIAPALVLAASTAVRAETPPQEIRHQVVAYDDLNLNSPAGAAAFQARLKGAVQAVCGPKADLRNFDEDADYKACLAKAAQDAMAALPQARQQAARPAPPAS
jgi:UrcA family protein